MMTSRLHLGRSCFFLAFLGVVFIAAEWSLAQIGRPAGVLSSGGFESGTDDWTADPGYQLIKDSDVAHNGTTCLTGEVTEPNQALRLVRAVKVKEGNRYELEMWAKGTNRTKLVLWAKLPGTQQRTMIASWPNITGRWQRYRAPIRIKESGMLHLEIIAPSSYGAPTGRIWLDDIQLFETMMPTAVRLTGRPGFHDEPAMAATSDGLMYVAYNRFIDGTDSLQIDRLRMSGNKPQQDGSWQVVRGADTYIMGPHAIAAGNRVAVTYAAEQQRDWDVYALLCGPEGPGEPIAVTRAAGVDAKPAAAWHDGTLWIAWESNRNGFRQIFTASVRDSKVSPPVAVSPEGVSSYDPSIAVLPGGEVCVAWHAFESNNYDIHLRRADADGKWSPPRRLTAAPTIDRHAMLFSHGNSLWIVYENAQTERYHVSRTNRRRLVVAKIESDSLAAPRVTGKSVLDQRCEGAKALFDEAGRLWIAMLQPRLPRAGWDVYLSCWTGDRWLTPVPVSDAKGMDRTCSLVVERDRAYVAFQADDMPRSWSDLDLMAKSTSDIYLAIVDLKGMGANSNIPTQPLVESAEPFAPATIRVDRGEDQPTRTIRYDGKTYQLYYGDLHEHSDVSVCNRPGDQSLDESYQHLRDLARHDFVCITDHGYNLNTYLWNYSAKWARINDDPERFLTFLGQEWTSTFEETSHTHPFGFYGHRNLILADLYFPNWWNARNRQKPSEVWEDLRRMKANFVHIPHQLADTGNVPTDWRFHDEVAQPVAEIFQTRGSYEYFGAPRQAKNTVPGPGQFLQDAWAQDIVIGVIASPDHGGGYGKACVYAERLTRESILDALRARRCYGTTAAKIFLDVRVNGHLMGEKLVEPAGESVKIDVIAEAPMPISKIELCRSNTYIDSVSPQDKKSARVTFVDATPLTGRCYYYVRVTLVDEEIAWSSPVWFGVDGGHSHEQ